MPTQSTSPHLPFGENKNAEWYGKDILSVKQFNRENLEYVFGVAHEMRGMVERIGTHPTYQNDAKCLKTGFFNKIGGGF